MIIERLVRNPPLIGFTRKERDTESGLDYFGARYFSGAQGRFTNPDEPFADQDPIGPQSWNLYSYVRNNPFRFTDTRLAAHVSSGHKAIMTTVGLVSLAPKPRSPGVHLQREWRPVQRRRWHLVLPSEKRVPRDRWQNDPCRTIFNVVGNALPLGKGVMVVGSLGRAAGWGPHPGRSHQGQAVADWTGLTSESHLGHQAKKGAEDFGRPAPTGYRQKCSQRRYRADCARCQKGRTIRQVFLSNQCTSALPRLGEQLIL